MSWMDSWSRPSKQSATPPPLYLTVGDEVPYCHTCGRVMSNHVSKSTSRKKGTPVKYCSDRCRNRKPGPLDRKIESAIVALLNAEDGSGVEKTKAQDRIVKGDRRIVVTMEEIEEIMFGSRFDPNKVYGRRKNRASRAIGGDKQWKSVDMETPTGSEASEDEDEMDNDDGGSKLDPNATTVADGEETTSDKELPEMVSLKLGPRIRPPQAESDVNFSVGGERGKAEKIEESPADLEKRNEGQRKAEEREMVRRAARRGVVFGFLVDQEPKANPAERSKAARRKKKNTDDESDHADDEPQQVRRKCEALMHGSLVEPSFAKGNWSVRWRE